MNHRISLWGSQCVLQLHGQTPIQLSVQCTIPWQRLRQCRRKLVRVNRPRDSRSDGAANAREQADECQHTSDILVRSSGHNAHFLANNEGTAAECDEDLAHDDHPDIKLRLTVMNHETHAEHLETEHGDGEVLDSTRDADYHSEDHGPETGADAVDVGDVAGICNREVVHGLEVVVEVRVPLTKESIVSELMIYIGE